ncbi:unnamed protein product [Musa hybrid cultivar]
MGAFRDPCGERDFEELIASLVEQVNGAVISCQLQDGNVQKLGITSTSTWILKPIQDASKVHTSASNYKLSYWIIGGSL